MDQIRTYILIGVALLLLGGVVLRFALPSGQAQPTSPQQLSPAQLEAVASDPATSVEERMSAVAHMIGPGGQGADRVRRVYDQADHDHLRAQCLLVLSDAGDFESMGIMIDGLEDRSLAVRQAAFTSVTRMTGGIKIEIAATPGQPTPAERAEQARQYRNLWIAINRSGDIEKYQRYKQGEP